MQGSTFTAAYMIGNDLLRRNGEYPAFDGLGSARAETNSSGTATATQDFDAFGNTIAASGSTSSPYNFAGNGAYASLACPERSRGGDAGLQHVGARYYDPQVGRFASRDGMLDQIPYAYCGGEPNDWVDPSGTSLDSVVVRFLKWTTHLEEHGGGAVDRFTSPFTVIGLIGDLTGNHLAKDIGSIGTDVEIIGGGLVLAGTATTLLPALIGVGLVTYGGWELAAHLSEL